MTQAFTEADIKAALDGKWYLFSADGEVIEKQVRADSYCGDYKPRFMTTQEIVERREIAAAQAAKEAAMRAAEASAAANSVIKVADIVRIVSAVCDVHRELLTSEKRQPKYVRARFMIYWLVRKFIGASLPQIGRILRRDHSSVLHGIKCVEGNRAKYEPELSKAEKKLNDIRSSKEIVGIGVGSALQPSPARATTMQVSQW